MERKHLPVDEVTTELRSAPPLAKAADQANVEATPEVLPAGAEVSAGAPQPKRPLPERIAERLEETRPGPLAQIIRMLGLWGPERE